MSGTYLTSEQFDHILNEVLKYMAFLDATPGRVTISGGEFMLFDSMRKCVSSGFTRIALLTNGDSCYGWS